jgi:predicted RNase H-like nuclease (RuvC/YqgF family)
MFEMAKAADVSQDTVARIQQMAEDMKQLKAKLPTTDLAKRLTNSQLRIGPQQIQIQECMDKIQTQQAELDRLRDALAGDSHQDKPVAEQKAQIAALDTNIADLFEERDALVDLLADSNARITKLEDLVRQLTLQLSTAPHPNTSPASTQRIPVQTTNGQSIALSVPKGSALRSAGKENRSPVAPG